MKYAIIITLLLTIVESSKEEIIKTTETKPQRIDINTLELTLENLSYVIDYYELNHKDIIIRQSILETGWFKSYNCKKRNNLFGLYDSRNNRYFSFPHWSDSVRGYKESIYYRYKSGDYYKFLINIGYAEDKLYISKLKSIKYDIHTGAN